MVRPPHHAIDPAAFWADPYPDLAEMRDLAPVVEVPQLGAVLLTRRDDVFTQEKRIEVFSSHQPEGLMTRLMGENMMRKDGAAHLAERRAIFPTVSPRCVRNHWRAGFVAAADRALDRLAAMETADLVHDYAMEVSAEALKAITGLVDMPWRDMDRVSQAMIDGCANYAGDPAVEARCHAATALIDRHIDARLGAPDDPADLSLIAVQRRAGLSDAQLRANVKLVISGGQNEPRDAIAGTAWALLAHPDQLALIRAGRASWSDAFEEYARWIAPIGMSPRRIARDCRVLGVDLAEGTRAFLMFGAANRDPAHFARPDAFDLTQDRAAAVSFGAGPHFCAGAWAARCLIGEVALPMLFHRFPDLALDGPAPFGGWAFRGPLRVPVRVQVRVQVRPDGRG